MSRAFLLKYGNPRSMPSAEAEGIASDHDFLWLHLDGRDESAIATIQSNEGIPAIARSALLQHETRPRCAVLNGGALINLRGLGATPADDPDALVSIRMWAEKGRVITTSIRNIQAYETVDERFMKGDSIYPGARPTPIT